MWEMLEVEGPEVEEVVVVVEVGAFDEGDVDVEVSLLEAVRLCVL